MKFDNRKNIILMILGVLCVVLLLIGAFYKTNKSDIKDFKEEYEAYNGKKTGDYTFFDVNIELNNKVSYIAEEDLLKAMDNETAIFYFGFPTCPWCRNMVEPLLKVAKDRNIKIYYFNPKEIRSNDNKTYDKLVKKVDKYLEKDENGNKVLYVPDVYFIKNGKIVDNHLGSLDTQKDPFVKLNTKQTKELENIFDKLIDKMK